MARVPPRSRSYVVYPDKHSAKLHKSAPDLPVDATLHLTTSQKHTKANSVSEHIETSTTKVKPRGSGPDRHC